MIPRDLFERYRDDLELVLEAGKQGVFNLYMRAEQLAESQEELDFLVRTAYSETIRDLMGPVDVIASDFYTDERAEAGVTSEMGEVRLRPLDTYDAALGMVVDEAMAHDGAQGRVGKLQGAADRMLMGRAESVLEAHARADPDKPLWAIVPQPGACAFCLTVASRGFKYRSESAAGRQRHDGCRCTPVVDHDTKNPALEGYDIKELEDLYDDLTKRAGSNKLKDITKVFKEQMKSHESWEEILPKHPTR